MPSLRSDGSMPGWPIFPPPRPRRTANGSATGPRTGNIFPPTRNGTKMSVSVAALLHLFPRTWTGTLPLDTYPVRISPDSIRPGTLFLVTESHTGIIGRVFLDGSQPHPLQTWESALPVKIQKLNLRYFFSGRPDVQNPLRSREVPMACF